MKSGELRFTSKEQIRSKGGRSREKQHDGKGKPRKDLSLGNIPK